MADLEANLNIPNREGWNAHRAWRLATFFSCAFFSSSCVYLLRESFFPSTSKEKVSVLLWFGMSMVDLIGGVVFGSAICAFINCLHLNLQTVIQQREDVFLIIKHALDFFVNVFVSVLFSAFVELLKPRLHVSITSIAVGLLSMGTTFLGASLGHGIVEGHEFLGSGMGQMASLYATDKRWIICFIVTCFFLGITAMTIVAVCRRPPLNGIEKNQGNMPINHPINALSNNPSPEEVINLSRSNMSPVITRDSRGNGSGPIY